MKFEEIEVVASVYDWPEFDVLKGDIGTLVHVYNAGEAYEVEFIDPKEGYLIALLTMGPDDIRKPAPDELVARRGT